MFEFLYFDEPQNSDMKRNLVGNVTVELITSFKTISEQNMDYILR